MQSDYSAFILAAYLAAVLGVGGLCLWVFLDARAQKRALAALEAQGIRRRSSPKGEEGA